MPAASVSFLGELPSIANWFVLVQEQHELLPVQEAPKLLSVFSAWLEKTEGSTARVILTFMKKAWESRVREFRGWNTLLSPVVLSHIVLVSRSSCVLGINKLQTPHEMKPVLFGRILSHKLVLATFEDNKIQSAELNSESNKFIHILYGVFYIWVYNNLCFRTTILYNLLSLPNLGRELTNVTLCSEFQFGWSQSTHRVWPHLASFHCPVQH